MGKRGRGEGMEVEVEVEVAESGVTFMDPPASDLTNTLALLPPCARKWSLREGDDQDSMPESSTAISSSTDVVARHFQEGGA